MRILQSKLVAHLAMDAQERIEAGEPPETARQAARRDLGNLTRVTEDTRATWGWTGVEHVLQDLRYAGRQLKRRPGFAVVVIATLAVGIGPRRRSSACSKPSSSLHYRTSSRGNPFACTSRNPTSPPRGTTSPAHTSRPSRSRDVF